MKAQAYIGGRRIGESSEWIDVEIAQWFANAELGLAAICCKEDGSFGVFKMNHLRRAPEPEPVKREDRALYMTHYGPIPAGEFDAWNALSEGSKEACARYLGKNPGLAVAHWVQEAVTRNLDEAAEELMYEMGLKTRPAAVMHEDAPRAIIIEIGNQIHNLGCERHGDEELSERLGNLASRIWAAAKLVSPEPTTKCQGAWAMRREGGE